MNGGDYGDNKNLFPASHVTFADTATLPDQRFRSYRVPNGSAYVYIAASKVREAVVRETLV